jgi:hypothetical protein
MESLVQQIGIDHLLHFFFCFSLMVILTARFGKKRMCEIILLMLGVVMFKEAHDIFINTHHLTASVLVCDSLWDLAGNLFGLVAATICIERLK